MTSKEWIKAVLPHLIESYGQLGSMFMELNIDSVTIVNHPGAREQMNKFICLGNLIEEGKNLYGEQEG